MSDHKDITDVVKNVPQVYEDGLKPAVTEAGKTLALLPRTINAALAPLQIWIENKEYNVAATKKLLEKKLEGVGTDNIVSPEAYVAVPAIQSISYSMNSDDLRDLYANLLASSMIKETKWDVHPSFVEIIRQLTPDEAKLLKYISDRGNRFPLIDVRLVNSDHGYITEVHNFTTLAEGVCDNPENIYEYIDNLCRLKIIEIPFGAFIKNEDAYKPLKEFSEIKDLISGKAPERYKWDIVEKEFAITQYGQKFIDTCVKAPV